MEEVLDTAYQPLYLPNFDIESEPVFLEKTTILMVTTKNLIHSLLYMFMFVISVTAMILYLNAVFLEKTTINAMKTTVSNTIIISVIRA